MSTPLLVPEARVGILVDCDNVPPEILEYTLEVAARFGRIVLRRGYGNHETLSKKWQEALVRQAFTPRLQYQYAPKKNTSDIALALDALETLIDQRANTFCVVTSDSDFVYLCHRLRERGASVYVVGKSCTPEALRQASDRFFEWELAEPSTEETEELGAVKKKTESAKAEPSEPNLSGSKQRPIFVVRAVKQLIVEASDDWVSLGGLGNYLKRIDPSFSPGNYGHAGLLEMVKTYDLLVVKPGNGGGYVGLSPKRAVAARPGAEKQSNVQ